MVQNAVSTRRRGMVLMIVLALLAMVSLTAVTFLLTTEQFRDASEQNRKMGEFTLDPDAMLQDAVMQVIRGTNNQVDGSYSPIHGNSLLEDIYGTEAPLAANISLAYSGTERGMLKFSGGEQRYVGAVLTCIDENSRSNGLSTVILAYENGALYAAPLPTGQEFDTERRQYMVNQLPFQNEGLDFDAPGHDLFMSVRNPETGKVIMPSFASAAEWNGISSSPYTMSSEAVTMDADADNDGVFDSRWMDLGLPVHYTANGTAFKPLFGILVEDMDGKINVNVHGKSNVGSSGSGTVSGTVGRGFGPMEVALEKVVGTVASSLYSSRMGNTTRSPGTDVKGNWYENYGETISERHVQRTPMDILGQISYTVSDGTPVFNTTDNFKTPNGYDLDLGLETIQGRTYSGNTATNRAFSSNELEALIRPYDFDSPFLPGRLRNLLNNSGSTASVSGTSEINRLVTTASWDIPAIRRSSVVTEENRERMLPELLAGWPIDLLRAATFDSQDKWDEAAKKYPKRHAFMQCLYEIMKQRNIDMGGSGSTIERRRAQWCANVVDFLDPDSVMTPFKPEGETFTVFGCEQPEVLISETLAFHSRNTEKDVKIDVDFYLGGKHAKGPKSKNDTTVYENYPLGHYEYNGKELEPNIVNKIEKNINEMEKKGYGPDKNQDFDQYLRPQGALFVELVNANSRNAVKRPPNVLNDIYGGTSGSIDISKKTPNGQKSVWRIVVMKNDDTPEKSDTDQNLKRDETTDADFNASIYRTAYLAPVTNLAQDEFAAQSSLASLEPGRGVLIGPKGETVFRFEDPGSETDVADSENGAITVESSIKLSGTTVLFKGTTGSADGIAIESKENGTRFSLTEDGNYGKDNSDSGNFVIDDPRDKPIDRDNWNKFGTENSNRRMIHLQRLADPERDHNSETNPYITVDSMIVDLTVTNARTSESEAGVSGNRPSTIVSRQREKKAYFWEQDSSSTAEAATGGGGEFSHSFSKDNPMPADSAQTVTWFGWINRPAVSPFELMNVTNLCASELLYCYEPTDEAAGFEKTFGYLPKFTENKRREIFGYLRIPSPQTVTPMVLNRENIDGVRHTDGTVDVPFAFYSMYRDPGRINLNTIPSYRVLGALLDKTITQSDFSSKWPNTVQNPFRSIAEVTSQSVLQSSDFLQFLTSDSTSTLEDPASRVNLYRLANLATTRSNVYAVWIVMGFFEVDENGNIPANNLVDLEEIEIGINTGEAKRYRAFYLIDRSIPVGFEYGKNHNAEKVIMLKRMLQ